jgi:hypothetical protein
MLKKSITYTDYNGVERTEDFYFNLTRAEVVEMEAGEAGGYGEMIRKIIAAQDGPTIMRIFKEFIFKSYGEKSADGKYFNKSEELSRSFEHTEAYSELFMELCTDANAAAAFVSGILPLTDEQRKEFNTQTKTTKLPENT